MEIVELEHFSLADVHHLDNVNILVGAISVRIIRAMWGTEWDEKLYVEVPHNITWPRLLVDLGRFQNPGEVMKRFCRPRSKVAEIAKGWHQENIAGSGRRCYICLYKPILWSPAE